MSSSIQFDAHGVCVTTLTFTQTKAATGRR
ncbi:hypothetical protein GGR41_000514 [Paenalcaligenes hominis]|uniref:Uncharacterized protein n=1 Tax=Paenalcaligenes hominis TaxID=643674 RepID=A0ABX0WPL3_9BURK|nr:hypothetical protein [Paenalcaligenes hominis]